MGPAWELIAPASGGTVAGLAVAGGGTVFAATSVGVYRSSDGGETWTLPGTAPTVPFASAVVASPRFSNDRTLFACGADGLYRSNDAGLSWQVVLVGGRMFSVVVAADALTVLVATEDDGVLRSEDGGKSWTGANAGLLDLTVLCLALSPEFETDRTAFAGTASGLYRTRNGGRSWRAVEMTVEDAAVQCIALSPEFASERVVVVGTEADGLLRSSDAGSTWRVAASGGVAAIAFRDARTLAAATEAGVAMSTDGGQTWRIGDDGLGEPALCLVFDGDVLLAGLHRGGVKRSSHDSNTGLSARLDTSLVCAPDGMLFIGGLEEGVRVSSDRGVTWAECNTGLDDLAIHGLAASATRVWAAAHSGLYANGPSGWERCSGADGPARMVAAAGHVVVVALDAGRLVRSADEGGAWQPVTAPWMAADVVALSVASDKTLFAVTAISDEVTLWRTLDDGKTWERWWVEHASGVSGRVALCAMGSDNVFVGLGGRVFSPLPNTREVRRRERRPLWRAAHVGREVVAITSLAARDGLVYAATNAGVFISKDRAATFADWSDGLDSRRIVAVTVSPESVYGLGLGGTVFSRDSG